MSAEHFLREIIGVGATLTDNSGNVYGAITSSDMSTEWTNKSSPHR